MTPNEIKELFIRAAETDRKLPKTEGPKPVKAMSLPYEHDFADRVGWMKEDLEVELKSYWAGSRRTLTPSDISDHELCNELILLVEDKPLMRHALWAWAKAKAGGKSFANWCRTKKVSKTWASELKDRAISQIATGIALNVSQNRQIEVLPALPVGHEISDKTDKMAVSHRSFSWRDDTAFQPVAGEHDFSWAAKRNEARRQRRMKQKKQEAREIRQ